MILFLLGFGCAEEVQGGREAWERLGRLGEVPKDPQHPSIEVPHVQRLSNRVSGLLQDVCRGFYRKLRDFYRMCCKWKFWVMVKGWNGLGG